MKGDRYLNHSASMNAILRDVLSLPDDAREWLMALWNAIQVFDDIADGDAINRDDLNAAISDTLVNMPANPFFQRNAVVFLPLLAVAILKWQASDKMERAGNPTEVSFVWRAGFYDIVLAVVHVCHGQAVALDVCDKVAGFYGENYTDYVKEMSNA